MAGPPWPPRGGTVDQDARGSLSAMAATLLACGGAGLIAGAPDWVTRVALAKTPPAVFGPAQDAQGPRTTTKEGIAIAIAEGSGSSQEPFAGGNLPPPSGLDAPS